MSTRSEQQKWFGHGLGEEVSRIETGHLDELLDTLFGYHLIQLGRPSDAKLFANSRIGHRVIIDSRLSDEAGVGTYSDFAALPLASDSIDLFLLPHTLETDPEPHQTLREVARCLIPEGRVVVVGFNPWSLWGAWRLVVGWRGRIPWCGHFYGTPRLRDWLELLGFETQLVRGLLFRPPLPPTGIMRRLTFLEGWGARWWPFFGGGYILVAQKRVSTLTQIKPRWRSRRLLHKGVAEPTTRNEHHE